MRIIGKRENLAQRKLKPTEVQRIVHFTNAIGNKQCQLLKDDAVTLLRLMPALLEAKSCSTVHMGLVLAVPIVKELYEQDPKSEEGQKYEAILKAAGKVCFNKRLNSTTEDRRIQEFMMFKSIVGNTPEYIQSYEHYQMRHRVGLRRYMHSLGESPNAISVPKKPTEMFWGKYHTRN